MLNDGKHEHTESQSQPGPQKCPEVLAYELWQQAGRPEGQAARFWKQAEQRISQLRRPAAVPVRPNRGRQEIPFQYPVA
jgi:hypothetical protein